MDPLHRRPHHTFPLRAIPLRFALALRKTPPGQAFDVRRFSSPCPGKRYPTRPPGQPPPVQLLLQYVRSGKQHRGRRLRSVSSSYSLADTGVVRPAPRPTRLVPRRCRAIAHRTPPASGTESCCRYSLVGYRNMDTAGSYRQGEMSSRFEIPTTSAMMLTVATRLNDDIRDHDIVLTPTTE